MHDEADEVTRLLRDLETELVSVGEVGREDVRPGIVMVDVTPRNPDAALPMRLLYLGDEIVFQAGHRGGRWELSRTRDDIAFLRRLVHAVVEGQVRETFGPKRSRVEVTLEDGTIVSETGSVSLWPAPGWKRRGRAVEYAPYSR